MYEIEGVDEILKEIAKEGQLSKKSPLWGEYYDAIKKLAAADIISQRYPTGEYTFYSRTMERYVKTEIAKELKRNHESIAEKEAKTAKEDGSDLKES